MSLEDIVSGAYHDADWWPRILTSACNPVTQTLVELRPPLEFAEHELYTSFCEWYLEECRVLWQHGEDPQEMDASDWRGPGDRASV